MRRRGVLGTVAVATVAAAGSAGVLLTAADRTDEGSVGKIEVRGTVENHVEGVDLERVTHRIETSPDGTRRIVIEGVLESRETARVTVSAVFYDGNGRRLGTATAYGRDGKALYPAVRNDFELTYQFGESTAAARYALVIAYGEPLTAVPTAAEITDRGGTSTPSPASEGRPPPTRRSTPTTRNQSPPGAKTARRSDRSPTTDGSTERSPTDGSQSAGSE